MNHTPFHHHVMACATAALVYALCTSGALAQTIPDAGRLLQEQTRQVPQLPKVPDFQIQAPSTQRAAPGGPQVALQSVQFEGNTALTGATLQTCLGADVIGKAYDLAGLQDVADKVSACYRSAGYPFARAFVPSQNMQGGALRLQIVEGRYGQVRIIGNDTAQAAASYLTPLKSGEVITSAPLERATLLLSDLPGYWLEPVMQPGQTEGTGDLLLDLKPYMPLTGQISTDNMGSRYTGMYRMRLDLQLNSPLMVGDQLSFNGIQTNGDMKFGSLGYALPLGGDGLRLSASASKTAYLLGDKFASANVYGTANVVSVGLSYPWLRSREQNLNLSGQLQKKRLHDAKDGLDSHKSSDVLPLTLGFDRRDDWLGGGVVYGSVSYAYGHLNLDEMLGATDAETARTAGRFTKWNLDMVRKQALPEGLEGNARMAVQWTGQNLDSSEKFSLGGPTGVRAYPSGEGLGDRGWLLQAELRAQWAQFNPYAFVDLGSVRTNINVWDPSANNQRHLSGAGMGVKSVQGNLIVDASLAWRVQGGLPQADTVDKKPRMWVSVAYKL
jgi:hemolysin activation/secretion protein